MPNRALAAVLVIGFAASAQAQGAPPDPAPGARPREDRPAARPTREPSIGQIALRERQRKCGAEWKELKAGGKVADGMRWPKFWSQCNARLKGSTV